MNTRQPLVAKIAQSGPDRNDLIWPGKVLREAAHLFEGVPVYANHEARAGGYRHPSSIDRWGHLKSVQYVGDDDGGYLCGLIIPDAGRIEMLLREAAVTGQTWGLSVHVGKNDQWCPPNPPKEYPDARVIMKIRNVRSVDLVQQPAMSGCRVITEANGVPIRPDDDRVPLLLMEGRAESPTATRDPLAALERRLERIIEAGDRKAAVPSTRRVVSLQETIDAYSTTTADAFMAAFTRRYGPGPWKIRSVARSA